MPTNLPHTARQGVRKTANDFYKLARSTEMPALHFFYLNFMGPVRPVSHAKRIVKNNWFCYVLAFRELIATRDA